VVFGLHFQWVSAPRRTRRREGGGGGPPARHPQPQTETKLNSARLGLSLIMRCHNSRSSPRSPPFLAEQLWYLLPLGIIALPLFFPKAKRLADATTGFDRRIVTLLAFGPAATLVIISAATGWGPQTMWGYPLWLFLGLWCVIMPTTALDHSRLTSPENAHLNSLANEAVATSSALRLSQRR
jgi:hypothetical protein